VRPAACSYTVLGRHRGCGAPHGDVRPASVSACFVAVENSSRWARMFFFRGSGDRVYTVPAEILRPSSFAACNIPVGQPAASLVEAGPRGYFKPPCRTKKRMRAPRLRIARIVNVNSVTCQVVAYPYSEELSSTAESSENYRHAWVRWKI